MTKFHVIRKSVFAVHVSVELNGLKIENRLILKITTIKYSDGAKAGQTSE